MCQNVQTTKGGVLDNAQNFAVFLWLPYVTAIMAITVILAIAAIMTVKPITAIVHPAACLQLRKESESAARALLKIEPCTPATSTLGQGSRWHLIG